MPRRLRYSVAMSLDGFIADENGGYAWIPEGDAIDFGAFLDTIGGLVLGRGSYEVLVSEPTAVEAFGHLEKYVVSTTLDPEQHPGVTLIRERVGEAVADLKGEEGKDLWLFGGGVLFRSLLEAGVVDRVEVAVIPILLGQGVPLLPGGDSPTTLELHSSETFDDGIVLMKYDVVSGD